MVHCVLHSAGVASCRHRIAGEMMSAVMGDRPLGLPPLPRAVACEVAGTLLVRDEDAEWGWRQSEPVATLLQAVSLYGVHVVLVAPGGEAGPVGELVTAAGVRFASELVCGREPVSHVVARFNVLFAVGGDTASARLWRDAGVPFLAAHVGPGLVDAGAR